MRLKRFTLPAALAALSLGLATAAAPAFADDLAGPAVYPVTGDLVFSSPTTGEVSIDYTCAPDVPGQSLGVDVSQHLGVDGDQAGHASGSASASCDGSRYTARVELALTAGDGIVPGPATLEATLGTTVLREDVRVVRAEVVEPTPTPDPTPTQPPAPAKAPVRLTTNASPESVTRGRTITIKGTIRRDGKKFRARTRLEFAPDSNRRYARVRTVTSSRAGNLSTKVKASRSGSFRYVYAGNTTTRAATSSGDHIVVKAKPAPKPKPKAYANCTELRKVYPHGVGRSGARDRVRGSTKPVTSFTRDSRTYAKNTKSDRDKDGIACERR